MSRNRREAEYYRLPTVIDDDIGADNITTLYSNTNAVSGQIKNVTEGTDPSDAATISQLQSIFRFDHAPVLTINTQLTGAGTVWYSMVDANAELTGAGYDAIPDWATGLIVRWSVSVDGGSSDAMNFELRFRVDSGTGAYETVAVVEDDQMTSQAIQSNGDTFLAPAFGNNYNYQYGYTFTKDSTGEAQFSIKLIGYYR